MQTLLYVMDLFGVAVFAITGSLAAGKKRMDLFGVVVLATVTALGGGTLRDLILGASPVFWVSAPVYLLVAVATAIVTFFLVRFCGLPLKLLSIADAFGLAVFTVLGTQKALDMGISPGIAVVMGIMTGVVGGIIRDILSGEIPLILHREIYATASLCGAVTFCLVSGALQNQSFAAIASVIVTLVLRLSAIKWKMSLPLYISHEGD
ncbi:MAG: trimeric intracellular cation channel family protein [Sedimentisphaerales bacterium]|nr:trimeric intracellular cation channel family protein [Sedimentisphaerales bacterium]